MGSETKDEVESVYHEPREIINAWSLMDDFQVTYRRFLQIEFADFVASFCEFLKVDFFNLISFQSKYGVGKNIAGEEEDEDDTYDHLDHKRFNNDASPRYFNGNKNQ